MKKTIIAGSVLCWFVFMAATAGATGEWELILSDNGIDTYQMKHPDTPVRTFRGVGFVEAGIEIVGAVIRDIPSYPKWMADCRAAEILEEIDRNTYIFHNVISTPFPYKDRDMVVENEAVYNLENGTAGITFNIAEDYDFPEKRKYYRLQPGQLKGQYYLEYFGRDRTRITYQHKAHPGGNIPVAIANYVAIRNYPAKNIEGLRKMAAEKSYIEAGRASEEYFLIEAMIADRATVGQVLKTRIGDYIIDPVLLEMMFATSIAGQIVSHVHAEKTTFASIRQAVLDMLNIVAHQGLKGDYQAEVYRILTYLADKPFDEFFDMKKFMGETWLLQEVAAEKNLIHGLLDKESDLARLIFEKITASETAVTSFIKDRHLADKIINDQEIRTKLWQDEVLRQELIENLGSFASLEAFESFIAQRVEEYQ